MSWCGSGVVVLQALSSGCVGWVPLVEFGFPYRVMAVRLLPRLVPGLTFSSDPTLVIRSDLLS